MSWHRLLECLQLSVSAAIPARRNVPVLRGVPGVPGVPGLPEVPFLGDVSLAHVISAKQKKCINTVMYNRRISEAMQAYLRFLEATNSWRFVL